MGHDVRYLGKLTPKNPLNNDEIALLKELQDHRDFDYLYALEYRNDFFIVNDRNEKLYPDGVYEAIEKYVTKLKEGGNDLVDGSYLISCSEYGIDDEAIIFSYKNGRFTQKLIIDLVKEYLA